MINRYREKGSESEKARERERARARDREDSLSYKPELSLHEGHSALRRPGRLPPFPVGHPHDTVPCQAGNIITGVAGVPRLQETHTPQDPTVARCLEIYGGPKWVSVSCERVIPVFEIIDATVAHNCTRSWNERKASNPFEMIWNLSHQSRVHSHTCDEIPPIRYPAMRREKQLPKMLNAINNDTTSAGNFSLCSWL